MPTPMSAKAFEDMINEDRKRRKAEELAQQIFGKNRKGNASAPGTKKATQAKGNQQPSGSLASRMGVNKRPSFGPGNAARTPANASQQNNQNRNKKRERQRNGHNQQAQSSSEGSGNAGGKAVKVEGQRVQDGVTNTLDMATEINIRGAAGPYCVIASNFAPGTTAADIASVMSPVGGEMLACKLITSQPTVIVEMVFSERSGADNVIAMFNNKRADGRMLYVYMKEGGPSQPIANPSQTPFVAPAAATPPMPDPQPAPIVEAVSEDQTMEVDDYTAAQEVQPNEGPLEHAPREPYRHARDNYRNDYRGSRGSHPEIQDGRYGFVDLNGSGGGYGGGGYRGRGGYGGGGGYRNGRHGRYGGDDGRMYADSMMGRGGQRYRS